MRLWIVTNQTAPNPKVLPICTSRLEHGWLISALVHVQLPRHQCRQAMPGRLLCCFPFSRSLWSGSIQYAVRNSPVPQVMRKTDNFFQYKSHLTSGGCSLDVSLLRRPMRIGKDREVSRQCASSTPVPGKPGFLSRCLSVAAAGGGWLHITT